MKKLYFVKREVMARSIEEATRAQGIIYEVTLAKEQPAHDTTVGFKEKKKINRDK